MTGPVVQFDGACALCTASVRFIRRREPAPRLTFEPQVGIESLRLVEGGRVHVRSGAALRITRYMRWPWPLLRVFLLVPSPMRDWLYDLVARHRHRFF